MRCFVLRLAILARRWLKTLAIAGTVFSLVVVLYAPAAATTMAYYRFEEGIADSPASGTGSVIDSSTYGNHGTPYGGPIYRSDVPVDPVPRTGESNNLSLEFDGVDDYVSTADIDFSGDFTLMAWFYSYSVDTDYRPILSKQSGASNHNSTAEFNLQVQNNGNLNFFMSSPETEYDIQISGGILSPNTWYHVAIVMSSNTATMYLDGISKDSDTYEGTRRNGTRDMLIGQYYNQSGFQRWRGEIDEVLISDSALSPSEFLNAPIPEPTTIVLMGFGILGLLVVVIRQRRKEK